MGAIGIACRQAHHFFSRDAVHHDQVLRIEGDVAHRVLHLKPGKHAVHIGAELDPGADLAEFGRLFQNDAGTAAQRQRPRQGKPADAAAGDDDRAA